MRIILIGIERDVVDLVESMPGHALHGFLAPSAEGSDETLRHLGPDAVFPDLARNDPDLRVVLSIDFPKVKARVYAQFGPAAFASLVSPHAYVSQRSRLGPAAVVQRNVTIMANVRTGIGCKINVGATLHHDVALGDFCTIAPQALLLGNVTVEDGTFIGAGAIIRQRCRVGAGATVGAGAVVVKDVPPGATVVGVPASRDLGEGR
jgi:sugar O-acyltransferase (sialic acid O-acetyltransferase NeuD family)